MADREKLEVGELYYMTPFHMGALQKGLFVRMGQLMLVARTGTINGQDIKHVDLWGEARVDSLLERRVREQAEPLSRWPGAPYGVEDAGYFNYELERGALHKRVVSFSILAEPSSYGIPDADSCQQTLNVTRAIMGENVEVRDLRLPSR